MNTKSIQTRSVELQTAISIARDCLDNMIERATDEGSVVELVEFARAQLGDEFDALFALLVRERSAAARAERLPQVFLVSAKHQMAKWAACLETVTCHIYPEVDLGQAPKWYATSDKYGCGKNASTPEAAILALLRDHGCTEITSTRVTQAHVQAEDERQDRILEARMSRGETPPEGLLRGR